MIVKIRAAKGPRLFIPIPMGLFCNRLTAGIAAKVMEQNGMTLTPAQLVKLMRVIRQCKCRHRNWVLVEVESAEGDRVLIKP